MPSTSTGDTTALQTAQHCPKGWSPIACAPPWPRRPWDPKDLLKERILLLPAVRAGAQDNPPMAPQEPLTLYQELHPLHEPCGVVVGPLTPTRPCIPFWALWRPAGPLHTRASFLRLIGWAGPHSHPASSPVPPSMALWGGSGPLTHTKPPTLPSGSAPRASYPFLSLRTGVSSATNLAMRPPHRPLRLTEVRGPRHRRAPCPGEGSGPSTPVLRRQRGPPLPPSLRMWRQTHAAPWGREREEHPSLLWRRPCGMKPRLARHGGGGEGAATSHQCRPPLK